MFALRRAVVTSFALAVSFGASARLYDGGAQVGRNTLSSNESYRLDQMSKVRSRREIVDACLDTNAKHTLATSRTLAATDIANVAYDSCLAELLSYATSLVALSPSPNYQSTARLVRDWRPILTLDLIRRLDTAADIRL